jgi:tRNA-dihydrouridine synthase B
VRMARKHIGWYAKEHPERAQIREVVLPIADAATQLRMVQAFFAD